MNIKLFNKISDSDVLIVPNASNTSSTTKRFRSQNVLIFFAVYTIVVAVIGFLIISITPLKYVIFPGSEVLSKSDMQKVEILNRRVLFLAKQLEDLKSTNDKLKYAIILGDSALIDSLKTDNQNNQNKKVKKNDLGGNLFYAVRKLFFHDEKDSTKVAHASSEEITYFMKPVNGFISRGFNPENGHMGIDFVTKVGTPVYASASGYVIFSGYTENYGYTLIIAHPDNYITVYKHCSVLLKRERDTIIQGEVIALTGNTGEVSTGPHLHFEIWKDGKPIDPEQVLINN